MIFANLFNKIKQLFKRKEVAPEEDSDLEEVTPEEEPIKDDEDLFKRIENGASQKDVNFISEYLEGKREEFYKEFDEEFIEKYGDSHQKLLDNCLYFCSKSENDNEPLVEMLLERGSNPDREFTDRTTNRRTTIAEFTQSNHSSYNDLFKQYSRSNSVSESSEVSEEFDQENPSPDIANNEALTQAVNKFLEEEQSDPGLSQAGDAENEAEIDAASLKNKPQEQSASR